VDAYDVIIVGTGAGGGTLAYALAPTGKRILLLERGGYLPREKANWDPGAVFPDARYKTAEVWHDGAGRAFRPEMNYYVGGNTKVYGAALLRMRERDFGEVRHHDGLSPAWPLAYADFEPYYAAAEHLYMVHGRHGEDPLDPPSSRAYAFAPLRHEPRIQGIADALRAEGLHPFPLPMAINRDDAAPRARPCIRCDTCDGFPCLVDAKCDAQVTCVDRAVTHGNVTLRINARVTGLRTNAAGTEVTQVDAEIDGATEAFSGGIVVIACGAINSAALLLRSAGDRHPRGLANSSDQVGRNLMLHNNSAMLAVSATTANPTVFQKTLGLNDFYFTGPDVDYPLGHIQLMGKSKPEMLRGETPAVTPYGALEYVTGHAVDWWMTTEDLPRPDNRVTLDAADQIVLTYAPNNEEPHRRLVGLLEQMLRRTGHAHTFLPHTAYFAKRVPLAAVCHQVGTCRFGTDPRTSVLDLMCRTHDVANLYVVDGSFFPSISSVNPSLTIIANALRVAEHLRARLGAA